MVGRDWTRWDADFGDLVLIPSRLANRNQPFCRGDDHFCRLLCGFVPTDSRGSNLGHLLGLPCTQPNGDVAKFQLSPPLGRVRGFYLSNRISALLVCRTDS